MVRVHISAEVSSECRYMWKRGNIPKGYMQLCGIHMGLKGSQYSDFGVLVVDTWSIWDGCGKKYS